MAITEADWSVSFSMIAFAIRGPIALAGESNRSSLAYRLRVTRHRDREDRRIVIAGFGALIAKIGIVITRIGIVITARQARVATFLAGLARRWPRWTGPHVDRETYHASNPRDPT
jgi:hypothetical protein